MRTADVLAATPLFKLLDASEIADLEGVFGRHDYAAGERVFSAGEPGDALYIVGSGEVELFVKDNAGTRIVLRRKCWRGYRGQGGSGSVAPRPASRGEGGPERREGPGEGPCLAR